MPSTASARLVRGARHVLCALSLASAPLLIAPGAAAARSAGTSYVVMLPGGHISTMNGTSDDYQRAEAYRAGKDGLIYFRKGGAAYVVRDAAMLRQAGAIVAPQQALGAKQGALGHQQGELGERQGALGAEQARTSASRAEGWSERMSELGRQQAALGAQQAALGAQQAELGRQQAAASKAAEKQFEALLADAIRRGLAEKVR